MPYVCLQPVRPSGVSTPSVGQHGQGMDILESRRQRRPEKRLRGAEVEKNGPVKCRLSPFAVLLKSGGEAVNRVTDTVDHIIDGELPGQRVASPAVSVHRQTRLIVALERVARSVEVGSSWLQAHATRSGEVQIPPGGAIEAQAHPIGGVAACAELTVVERHVPRAPEPDVVAGIAVVVDDELRVVL